MSDAGSSLRLRDLETRKDVFRWLWVRHDEVAAMKASDKRVWAKLARIGRDAGLAVTRDLLRNTWRTVEAEWARAGSELKSARVFEEKARAVGSAPKKPVSAREASASERPEILSVPVEAADDDEFCNYQFKTLGEGKKRDGE